MTGHKPTKSETEFLLLNGDPQSSPASAKPALAREEQQQHAGKSLQALFRDTRAASDVPVESMTTAELGELVGMIVGELKERGGAEGDAVVVEVGEAGEALMRAIGALDEEMPSFGSFALGIEHNAPRQLR